MMLAVEDVKKMSFEERLRSIELLKTSLLPDEEFETPAWHEEVLAERRKRIEAGEEKFYTLAEVRERRAKRLQAQ